MSTVRGHRYRGPREHLVRAALLLFADRERPRRNKRGGAAAIDVNQRTKKTTRRIAAVAIRTVNELRARIVPWPERAREKRLVVCGNYQHLSDGRLPGYASRRTPARICLPTESASSRSSHNARVVRPQTRRSFACSTNRERTPLPPPPLHCSNTSSRKTQYNTISLSIHVIDCALPVKAYCEWGKGIKPLTNTRSGLK